ncbi:alpha/beta fold hydrolase [Streptomyces pristinaespiralis]|uniref:alpha/beta fold hydrolase n=1 Tax=Streptomyces pristinaespiralis TaxID=38300 RepID=UPI0033D0F956
MTISFDRTGQGPTVVLLHSGVCDRRMWDLQWQSLADAGYEVVRCDFRGFGETPAETGPYSDADDVLELLDTLGIDRATLIGSSYGGKVALELAGRRPERAAALMLLCAGQPGRPPGPQLMAFGRKEDALLEAGDLEAAVELNVSTWLGPDADEETREAVRRMQRHAFEVQLAAEKELADAAPAEGSADAEETPGAAEAGAGPAQPSEPDLSRIDAPCLAVSGAHDVEDFRQIAAGLPALIPGARHVELDWAQHLPSLERPAEVTRLITGFLAGITENVSR